MNARQLKPWFKVLHRDENTAVVFDPSTNRIFEFDEVITCLLQGMPWQNNQLNGAKFGHARTLAGINELNRLFDLGCFQPPSIKSVQYAYDKVVLQDLMESGLAHLQIELTEQCNLRCKYCGYTEGTLNGRTHGQSRMTPETAIQALEYFMQRSMAKALRDDVGVTFYGGEPLMNISVIKALLEHAKVHFPHRRIYWHLITNGIALTNEIWSLFAAHKVHVTVSLDGPQELHDRYRVTTNGKPTHETILRNLRQAHANYPDYYELNVDFNICLTPPYDLKAVKDFATNPQSPIGLTERYALLWASIDGNAFFDTLMYNNSTCDALLEEWREAYAGLVCREDGLSPAECRDFTFFEALFGKFARGIARAMVPGARNAGATESVGLPCQPSVDKLFVRVDGSLAICEKCYAHPSLTIGDVASGIDIGALKDIVRLLEANRPSVCAQCWAFRYCSPCFMHVRFREGKCDIDAMEGYCAQMRKSVQHELLTYHKNCATYPAYGQVMKLTST